MNVKVHENNEKVLKFSIDGIRESHANALRRAAINSVKTFAIDSVTFYENTSPMFDEYIAHRIGLVPIITPSSGYKDDDEILFTAEATGPITVYSKDLQSTDKEVRVASEGIPIIKLGTGQRIRIDCKARMGTAYKHAKFQPGLIAVEPADDNSFNFYVESFGQMPPKEIINKACDTIKERIKEVAKVAKKL
ncbi:MAG: DNA-directed RNA polymerase subunit D [Candidatus Marsarchaeota archaeon]|jgi:DNA-directed RNA polymerase subunit D|nr:DNA-directed RNA polymerase subunit D [Candidatus Marsarchaeota archaeon]